MAVGEGNSELTRRQHALLMAMLQEFIATAEPVGSHQLAARHPLGVRAAMVRNLMGELEDSGFLHQPHTSAGRVPTEKAFRYYVDQLIPPPPIAHQDRTQIELHYSVTSGDVNAIIRDTSRLLALMTGQAALVTAPRLDAARLERVTFIRMRERTVLAIFIAAAGGVHHRLIDSDADHPQDELDRMAAYLNESLSGRTLEQARRWIEERLHEERARYDGFVRAALILGGAIAQLWNPAEVYVEGSSKAVEQPEFANSSRMRELLRALEDKTALLDLLERTLTGERRTMVSIGSENFDGRLAAFSVVAAPYASGVMPLGSVAVVGPVRMDYERVIPLVDYMARRLSRVLED
jgi:heat-inducible transcriptional repressor